ncbi:LysR family transcriptional regulator [Tahibacter soli]|uniref:LysR family transcriptional regulator n=1 Tax=Tahibacter soli TaxID=2983605 RepID=A0A9X3YPB9_9GAMM|nr:LysR family transcriptional regulator [Tahibacter soli]MDC8014463.1 LysR family transcriptional regulator [Tahibacter soli]
MDRLRVIETFVRAAELGSFQQAAVAQGITPQAVSKAVRQLEHELGVRLFHRTTRKSSLTEDGRRFLEAVKPALDEVMNAWRRTRRSAEDDEGLVRITAPGPVGRRVLVPLLVEFRRLYPKVQVDMLLDEHFTDIVAERIDVGLRCGSAPDAQLVVRKLFPIQVLTCAAPSYLAAHGAPQSLDDLARHACTGYRQPNTGRLLSWEFVVDGALVQRDVPLAICTNDGDAELEAVIAGIGIGQIDSISAAPHLRAGRIVPVLPQTASERHAAYLYYPQRTDMPQRVRRFIDFLVARLQGCGDYGFTRGELETFARAV